jgi:enterochelin esterase-like enzyme
VLEPQSNLLLALLIIAFAVLMWRIFVDRRLALRIVSACMSFVVATAFGVLVVNKYYGYYQTWGAAIADLTNQGVNAGPQVPANNLLAKGKGQPKLGGIPTATGSVYLKLARQQGYTLRMLIHGKFSHITRVVYVYLPPQYFEPRYEKYKFPVIELIHGQPGTPQDWINVVGVQVTLDALVKERKAKPVVLVMPDANGGIDISLQCLNQVNGPRDLTYLGLDVPDQITRLLRVQPPGRAWGIAGYSEGGFCAANMALRLRNRYGYAASLSGYFKPTMNQLGPTKVIGPFHGSRTLRLANTPLAEVRKLSPGEYIPQFWLGAGKDDAQGVADAEYFWQELSLHQAGVPLVLTPGGGHDMFTWKTEIPPMLIWMTNGLARNIAMAARHKTLEHLIAKRARKAKLAKHAAHLRHKKHHVK